MKIRLGLMLGLIAFSALGRHEVPSGPDEIVASWEGETTPPTTANPFATIRWHIEQGALPGQANLHMSRAKGALLKLTETAHQDPEYAYLMARLEQHRHAFPSAIRHLQSALAQAPDHAEARLLAASIYLLSGQYTAAREACSQLAGHTEILVTSTCLLEVAGHAGDLEKSYQVLSRIAAKRRLKQDSLGVWMAQILADQALQLRRLQEAETWLDALQLNQVPLSAVALWADVQLALGRHQRVLEQLQSLTKSMNFVDDALLVRLAMAEKKTGSKGWLNLAQERVAFRIARQDEHHAADLARYFLYVAPDKSRALHWAQVNWQQTRAFDDARLLAAAQGEVSS